MGGEIYEIDALKAIATVREKRGDAIEIAILYSMGARNPPLIFHLRILARWNARRAAYGPYSQAGRNNNDNPFFFILSLSFLSAWKICSRRERPKRNCGLMKR